jgi:hypothetical protein
MKRKIKIGDVFIDRVGDMRIIGRGDYVKVSKFTLRFLMTRKARYSFKTNRYGFSEYYLGNAIENKWSNK